MLYPWVGLLSCSSLDNFEGRYVELDEVNDSVNGTMFAKRRELYSLYWSGMWSDYFLFSSWNVAPLHATWGLGLGSWGLLQQEHQDCVKSRAKNKLKNRPHCQLAWSHEVIGIKWFIFPHVAYLTGNPAHFQLPLRQCHVLSSSWWQEFCELLVAEKTTLGHDKVGAWLKL